MNVGRVRKRVGGSEGVGLARRNQTTNAVEACAPTLCKEFSRETGNNFAFSKVFQFSGTSGSFPNSGVIVDAFGNLYGTTFTGGNAKCNCGVVFVLTP
jgi:uncharacterized repeat protein (TIGR03803 family)